MSKNCIECGSESPYRCPTCEQRYCSVPCCKEHKKKNCSPPKQIEISEESTDYRYPTDDTVPIEKLRCLEESEELKTILQDTQLQQIIKHINKEPNPVHLLKNYMQQNNFTEFVDIILNIVEPQEKEKPVNDIFDEL